MASVKACIKCATAPFIKFGQKLEATAISKTAAAPAGVKAEFESHASAGTDFAFATGKKMWANRSAIFWYRVERAFIEGRYVASGEYFKGYNTKMAVVDAQFLTRFLVMFILGTVMGRGQVYPFVTPSSPYALEMN